jgi:hypothetical protein
MSDVLNPVQVEQNIRTLANRISSGVSIVSNAEAKAREARRAYDLAFAKAYMEHEGPAHEKKYAATRETAAELEAADIAELAFKHAERNARALTEELRAWQSVGVSVRTMYGAAGVGER